MNHENVQWSEQIFPLNFLAGSFEGFWGISSAAEKEFVSES
jgi:hypothetical protein